MNTFGIILAGGKSSRFQGEDKSWVLWNNQPLIGHVIGRIQPQVDNILISANHNIEKYKATGYTVISDDRQGIQGADIQGPLAGIYSTMNYIAKKYSTLDDVNVLITPCDMPLLPENLLDLLNISHQPNQICVAKDKDRIQPLVALMPLTALDNLKSYLDSGQRKAEKWILDSDPAIVDLSSHAESFYNINNQDELNKLGKLAGESEGAVS